MSEVLVAIARWGDRYRHADPGSPPRMLMTAASQVLAPLSLAHQADLAVLRAEYDPTPAPPAPAPNRTTPRPPAGPGAPGRTKPGH